MSINKRQKAIRELLRLKPLSCRDLTAAKRVVAKKYGVGIISNSDIVKNFYNAAGKKISPPRSVTGRLLRKRAIRTMSGVAPVAVLTKPYPCPGKCAYCPAEENVPQSYLSNEPAVMRAIRCGYDPYIQVQERLRALKDNGHQPEKIELIVIGGTWSVLPAKYKYWFIKECFRGANKVKSKKLKVKNNNNPKESGFTKIRRELLSEQKRNEKTKYRIIGITLETRPDYVNEKELRQMRELGATRVELGAQAVDNRILRLNRRGHGVDEIARATRSLKDFGFKVTYHIMPGLPGATPAGDLKIFKALFEDERFQPDQIKLYPTVVTRGSLLYRWWQTGKYKPYTDKTLRNLIIKCKQAVPPYVRVIRLIRDIPGESIVAGNKITNLRQIIKDEGAECRCIRCREARERELKVKSLKLKVIEYPASGGREYFLQYTDKSGGVLYGFCRLRLPSKGNTDLNHYFPDAAIIRELHVYGELVPMGEDKKVQHAGLGKKLMHGAEKIARENGYKKIAVISGIGARDYYRRLGYRLEWTYMVKNLGK